jgi:hypothetical protein
MISPEQPHTAVYGNAIWVEHKTDGGRILRISADRSYYNENIEKIRSCFNIATSPTEARIYHRVVYSVGGDLPTPPIKWKGEFQLSRIPDGNPKPVELLGRFPCLFQFSAPHSNLPWLDAHRAEVYFKKSFLPLIPMLMQYCMTKIIFVCSDNMSKIWTVRIDIDKSEMENIYGSVGYICKTELDNMSFFQHHDCEIRQLPTGDIDPYWLSSIHLSNAYNVYENLDDDRKNKFLLGCEWLNKALNASDRNDQILFLTIMLEIFIPTNRIKCNECGQERYGIARAFKEYIPEIIGKDWIHGFSSALRDIYSLRSRISHCGIGVAQHLSGMIPQQWRQQRQVDFTFDLARQFLISWLYNEQG